MKARMIVIISLPNVFATQQLGRILGESLPAKSVVLLKGDLGAGKTTLVQGLAEGLGIGEPVLSPTFALINEYVEGRLPLYHLDLYRLQTHEVKKLFLELYWEGVEVLPGIVAIEWAERLPYYPPNYLNIELSFTADLQRQAKVEMVGESDLDFLNKIQESYGDRRAT
jgi:tRNA threonylcarbamoyladenosine biosynthesis protein TsaE